MKKALHILIICILASCKRQIPDFIGIGYANDSTISSKSGVIRDSAKFNLPAESLIVSISNYRMIDTFRLKVFSANYKCFKAPILYNYYLGNETYRLLWLRSFNRPVLITVTKAKKIILNTKILERQPKYLIEIFPDGILPTDPYERGIGYHGNDIEIVKRDFPGALIVKPKYDTKIILDSSIVLTKEQWKEFKLLLGKSSFDSMSSMEGDLPSADGFTLILEGHTKEKYHFVLSRSLEDNFGRCCEFLIKLSSVKDEDVY